MHNSLSILSFPCTIVCVDDSEIYLKTLRRILGNKYPIKSFQKPLEALSFFNSYSSVISKFLSLDEITDHEYNDTKNNLPVNFNLNNIVNLSGYSERFNEVGVIIVDYNMPELKGDALCNYLIKHPFKKIMLTNKLDHENATKAFNDGIINYFLPKDTVNLSESLNQIVEKAMTDYFTNVTFGLNKYLKTKLLFPHNDPVFRDFFCKFLNEHGIVEYYLIDKYGSYKLIDKDANVTYFTLHTDNSLNFFTDIYSEDENFTELVNLINERKLIPGFMNNINLNQLANDKVYNYFYKPNIINGTMAYYWCIQNKI